MHVHRTLIATALVGALALSGCGGGDEGSEPDATTTSAEAAPSGDAGDASGGAEVSIVEFAFDPGSLEVQVGDTVTFTNADEAAHTATGGADDPEPFDTGDIDGGSSAEVTFEAPGDYEYYCAIHEYMTGTVRVLG